MTTRDLLVGVRQKCSDIKQLRWPDDTDFLPMAGRGLVAIFRKRPESVCVNDTDLPVAGPTAPANLDADIQLRDEYQESLELYMAWILLNYKGSDKQVAAKADSLYQQFLAEVMG